MIKVCHMTSAHRPEDVRIFHKECTSLAKAGYDVTLIERGESCEKNGVHIIGVGMPPSSRLRRMTTFAKKIYRVALDVDADIYHFHDPELIPYGVRLKRAGKKVIFDRHEHAAETILEKGWIPRFARRAAYNWYRKYQKRNCRKLDAVITVTPNIVKYFQDVGCRTFQITNYPIIEPHMERPDYRARRIIFAGGISESWSHCAVLDSIHRISGCRYCLCGTVRNQSYLERLKSRPGWAQVDYMGKISHEQVFEQMLQCSVGIALLKPGRNTDWNNGTIGNTKIFEEMMAGLPVVCTRFNLWRAFVDKYHCGICVDPENVDEIADAIRYLLDHPEEAKKMGENGRRAVKEEFNWGIEEKKLLALYEDILNG